MTKTFCRQLFTLSLLTVTALIGILVLASYIPGVWLCDLLSQFRLVYAAVLLPCVAMSLLLRARLTIMTCIAVSAFNGIPILSMINPTACNVRDPQESITILNFNTEFQHNNDYHSLKALVTSRDPDVIALVEVNQTWIDAIEPFLHSYQFRRYALLGPGMAVFSKFPIESCDVRQFGKSHHPRISLSLRVRENRLNVLLAHPTTPKSITGYRERNQEISLIAEELKSTANPKVLIGDLNCGPWSSEFRRLLDVGLRDSEQGFGPQPSWPARPGRVLKGLPIPPLIPIDHVLVGDGLCVLRRSVGPAMHSDHLPVCVTVGFSR